MKKIIITGFSGFVSRHFLDYLYQQDREYEVLGLDIARPQFSLDPYQDRMNVHFRTCNLLEKEVLREIFTDFEPDYILHLAAFSSVAYSWEHPVECFNNNTEIFLNIVELLQELDLHTRVLSVGSSEEYGNVPADQLPLTEEMPLHPVSPYAVARVSQEMLSKVFVAHYDMDIILTRSFNHIGPYQSDKFAIPSFARRILDVKASGRESGEIVTGDTSVIRDFVDVRDVTRAYGLLLEKGKPGEVYNICSGRGVKLQDMIDRIATEAGVKITCRQDPKLIRPEDAREIVGSHDKITEELGWKPEISMETTLHDLVQEMQRRVMK